MNASSFPENKSAAAFMKNVSPFLISWDRMIQKHLLAKDQYKQSPSHKR